jgi:hypothetical protein
VSRLRWAAFTATCLSLATPTHAQDAHGIRGVIVGPIESSQQPGRGYGTDASAETLDELVALGANAIAVTPFGRIWSLDSTEIMMDFEAPYADNRAAIGRMIEQARARGLRVLLVPHLWVETPGWRGEMDPGSPERWAEFRQAYRRFVLAWARDAQRFGADAFSIGVECKSWSGRFGAYWTELIAKVRASFDGALTYSANWDEIDGVLFWDQLDWIGVNAFYPLAHENGASTASYLETAAAVASNLAAVGRLHDKPVVMLEVGYTARPNAAVEPWLWPDDMQDVRVDEAEQARALWALASQAIAQPRIAGFFLWRYYTYLYDVSQEAPWGFSPHAKLASTVLADLFADPWPADEAPSPWR